MGAINKRKIASTAKKIDKIGEEKEQTKDILHQKLLQYISNTILNGKEICEEKIGIIGYMFSSPLISPSTHVIACYIYHQKSSHHLGAISS